MGSKRAGRNDLDSDVKVNRAGEDGAERRWYSGMNVREGD